MRTYIVEIGDSIPFGGLGQCYPGFLFFQVTHQESDRVLALDHAHHLGRVTLSGGFGG
jgi:hypothetical protein